MQLSLKKILLPVFFVLVVGAPLFAQTQIQLLGAEYGDYSLGKYGNIDRLIGNVGFKHDNVTMYCDSAYLYKETNNFTAFNNVRIYQGDSITLFGDTLDYDGNTKTALLRGKVVTLSDRQMTLTTDALHYDASDSTGYYTTGGTIVNRENTLTSQAGFYNSSTKIFNFKKNVVLVNPEYTVYCDTLKYNTVTQYAYFFGPTNIYAKDSTHIYCENGWYNTKINYSQFSINSYIETKDKKLSADSMVYTGKTGIDQAFRNILLVDTTNKIEIRGQLGSYNRNTNMAWVTRAANAAMQVENDTLFITADTLRTWFDSTRQNRILYTYHHTKFFKKDLQGVCDSLQYSFKDSVINMEVNPVVWNEKNQITADTIRLYMKDGTVNSIRMMKNTFIVSEKDSVKHNQIRGRNAEGFFTDRRLRQVNVNSDVENVYYIEEDTGKYIGMYKVACGNMRIVITNNKVTDVHYYQSPGGTMYPMDKIPAGEDKLKGYKWQPEKRPMSKADVIPVYVPEKETPKAPEKPKQEKKPKPQTPPKK